MTLEERVAALEAQVAELAKQLEAAQPAIKAARGLVPCGPKPPRRHVPADVITALLRKP